MNKPSKQLAAGTIALGMIASGGCDHDAPLSLAASISPEDVWLVRTAPTDEPITYAMAPARGTIAIVDGCIRLKRDDGSSITPVYPHDYGVTLQSEELGVQDGSGHLLYSVGEHVELGGSVLADEPTERMVPANDRRECEGPYFLVMPPPGSR